MMTERYGEDLAARKCEANSLVVVPDIGRALCRDAILGHVDIEAARRYERRLARAHAIEEGLGRADRLRINRARRHSNMSVRKRAWVTRTGEAKEVWVVDYTDQHGRRHLKTFKRKKDADRYADQTSVDVRAGIHTPDATSITVAEAAADWLKTVTGNQRERATIATYREHVELHIVPRIGRIKLAKLTTPGVNAFKDLLLEQLSRALTQKVLISLKSILRDAQRRGTAVQNVATPVSIERDRRKQQLQVGVDIPTRDEISRLIAQADAWLRPCWSLPCSPVCAHLNCAVCAGVTLI
jgi:hypothetical protein